MKQGEMGGKRERGGDDSQSRAGEASWAGVSQRGRTQRELVVYKCGSYDYCSSGFISSDYYYAELSESNPGEGPSSSCAEPKPTEAPKKEKRT